MYAYDFGDDWEHVVFHEGMEAAEESLSYPRCRPGHDDVHPRTAVARTATQSSYRPLRTPAILSTTRRFGGREASTTLTLLTRALSCSTVRGSGGRRRSGDKARSRRLR
jgi:hypothetical protein